MAESSQGNNSMTRAVATKEENQHKQKEKGFNGGSVPVYTYQGQWCNCNTSH